MEKDTELKNSVKTKVAEYETREDLENNVVEFPNQTQPQGNVLSNEQKVIIENIRKELISELESEIKLYRLHLEKQTILNELGKVIKERKDGTEEYVNEYFKMPEELQGGDEPTAVDSEGNKLEIETVKQ